MLRERGELFVSAMFRISPADHSLETWCHYSIADRTTFYAIEVLDSDISPTKDVGLPPGRTQVLARWEA